MQGWTTGNMDIWVGCSPDNAQKLVTVLQEFGFTSSTDLFLEPNRVIRMSVAPFRIEILTTIDGVRFAECYAKRTCAALDEVEVDLIGLDHLKANKQASGRLKDLNDLENLP